MGNFLFATAPACSIAYLWYDGHTAQAVGLTCFVLLFVLYEIVDKIEKRSV